MDNAVWLVQDYLRVNAAHTILHPSHAIDLTGAIADGIRGALPPPGS